MQLIRRFVNWILGEPRQPLMTTAWKQPPPHREGPAQWGALPTVIDTERVPRSPEETAEACDFPSPEDRHRAARHAHADDLHEELENSVSPEAKSLTHLPGRPVSDVVEELADLLQSHTEVFQGTEWDLNESQFNEMITAVYEAAHRPPEFHAVIEWDIFAAPTAEEAAAEMWRNVCVSDGPVVKVTDKVTGEAHEVDLYPWLDGK